MQPNAKRKGNAMSDTSTSEIAEPNDRFRKSSLSIDPVAINLGKKFMTSGIQAVGLIATVEIAERVAAFDSFTEDNDPHGEHDFGSLDYDGNRIFWKESTTTTGAASEPGATWGAKTRAIRPRRCPSSPSCWRPNTDESRGLA